jgi:hypothetical protein
MSNKGIRQTTFALFLALILYACHTQRNMSTEKPHRFLSTNKIIDSVMKYELSFEYFASKISVDADFPEESKSFKVNLRIRKDSVIWMQITAVNIVVAQAVITKDSVKVLDKFHKKYYPRGFNYLNDLFDTELDFTMLQDMLVANAMSFDKDEKYKSPADSGFYYLTTLKKRKLRRAIEHDRVYKKHPVVYQYKFYPKNFRPYQVWINDLNDTTVLDVKYTEYEGLDSIPLPKQVEVEASKAAKKVKLKLEYKRTKLNEKTDYPFNIPDGYEKL